jgi:triphosphatase
MSEREIKLHVEPAKRARLLDTMGRRHLHRSDLSAIYFDTPGQLLSRHHLALRLRREDGRWVQTLKGACRDQNVRSEDEVPVQLDSVSSTTPAVDIALHRKTEVGRKLRKLLKRNGRQPLVEYCRTEITRQRRVLTRRGAVIEWALDEGTVEAGGRQAPISELELELKRGDPKALYALTHDWEATQGLWIDATSKAERGALLQQAKDFRAPVKAAPMAWSKRQARAMSGDAMLRGMVESCLSQILPNASEVARGSTDPDHAHQLRVGLRRLRSAAKGMKPFAANLPQGWEAAIKPVFSAIGRARDRHVLTTTVAPQLREVGAPVDDLPSSRSTEAEAGLKPVGQLVRGAVFQGVLLRLLSYALTPADDVPDSQDGSGLAHLTRHLAKIDREVTHAARKFMDMPFGDQHRVRKRIKRLRYLAEFASPAFDERAVKSWLEKISPAQDDLGAHMEFLQAGARFETLASTDARAWFAVGWLRAKADESGKASRASLKRLLRARKFWTT